MIENRINEIDFEAAKKDVVEFLKDKSSLDLWSAEFFIELTERLTASKT